MTAFEEGQSPGKEDVGEELEDKSPQVEKFPEGSYEETMEVFDSVRGVPDLDLETTIEDEVQEELGEELETDIEEGMHKDDFFTLLSNSRRRTLFRYMDIRSDRAPFSIGEISEVVAAHENDKKPKNLTSKERKRVYVALYQSHLPDIDRKGLIDFDDDRGIIDFPEDGNEYVFESLTELLEDEVYSEDQIVDEDYLEEVFGHEGYLSQLRQKLPF